jgi:peroxiredoxin
MKLLNFGLLWAAVLGLSAVPSRGVPLADSPEDVRPLAAGAVSPSAKLLSREGKEVELSVVLGGKPTILIFYRGGWCPFCNRHLVALGESYLELRKLGYQLVAISPDKLEALAGTVEKQHLLYKLFSDRAMEASANFGVAYRITAEQAAGYKGNGIDLAGVPGSADYWLPVPTAFVIGADGTIRFVHFNPDPSVRISSEELIHAATVALRPTAK